MQFSSITSRIIFWFVTLTILPIVVLAYSLLVAYEKELRQNAVNLVAAIADKKVNQIRKELEQFSLDAMLKAQDEAVKRVMLVSVSARHPLSSQQAQSMGIDFGNYLAETGYANLLLITPRGEIIHASRPHRLLGSNLNSATLQNSGLAEAVRKALQTQKTMVSSLDFLSSENEASESLASEKLASGNLASEKSPVVQYAVAPVFRQGKLTGLLALQQGSEQIYQVLLDRTGLGASGETVLGRKLDEASAILLSPIKTDADAAFRKRIALDDANPLLMKHAVNGTDGADFGIDYAGTRVAGAWRYLPELDAGMVSKLDEAEALSSMHQYRQYSLLAGGVVLLLALALAIIQARKFVTYLRNFSGSAQRLAAGDFATRLPETGRDEIGQIAVAFNQMVQRLKAMYDGLQQQVDGHTQDIKAYIADLKIKDAAITSSISAKAFAGMDGRLFYVNDAFVRLWKLPDASHAIGHTPVEFSGDPQQVQAAMQEVMTQGSWRGELRARLHDGAFADMEVVASLVMNEGKPLCLMASFNDITARKQAELEAKCAREQMSAIISALPDLMFELDLQGTYHTINTQQDELLVAPRDELYGKRVTDVMPAEAATVVLQALREANDEGVSHGRQICLFTPAGRLWFELSIARLQGNTQDMPHFIVMSREITARKQLEESLMRTADSLKIAQHLAQVGNWELNLLSGKLEWSDEIYNLFEIDRHKFSATYDAFLAAIHPDDRDMVNRAYTESLKSRESYQVIHRLQMADGRIKWVEERCESEFALDGTPLLSRGTVQDITRLKLAEEKLKESEARYAGVISALGEGIVINARDGTIVAANESAQKILGLTLEQMMGRKPVDPRWRAIHEDGTAFPGEEHPGSVTLRTGMPVTDVVMGVHKPDGSLTWISVNSQPIFQPGETLPSTVVASLTDITDRKHAEDQLRKSNEDLERRVELRTSLLRKAKEEAERANQSKSVFLTSMSHELRTPLNAILGYAQLMELDGSLSSTMLENAREVRRAGEFLLNLMNDVLDLSRIESGKHELKPEALSLEELVEDCKAQNIRKAAERDVALHFADSCSAYKVMADRRALLQVLNNLVSNAIKYNRAGGKVNVACSQEIDGRVKISVMDTGIGIAADKLSQLFQSFNRLGAEMGNIEGTGIGLVISKRLVEAMDGSIGVESIYGLGSTFWIELPCMRQSGEKVEVRQEISLYQASPQILVVEDYPPNQKVLQLQLQTLGGQVDLAENGEVALAMWRSKAYDLVLTDIDMPVMNGIELAKLLRDEEKGQGRRTPVVAITATLSEVEHKQYLAAGMDEVLAKPLTMDALKACMQRWLGGINTTPGSPAGTQEKQVQPTEASLPVLDLNYLYRILGQVNIDQARMLVDTFLKTADEGLRNIERADAGAAVIAKEMHKQKSSAKTVGALKYADMATRLEQQTKDVNYMGYAEALQGLRGGLEEIRHVVEEVFESDGAGDPQLAPAGEISVAGPSSVMIVDDDLVVLKQIRAMLDTLGVREVLTAGNGIEASRLLASSKEIEVLICDLSMPEMDGIELIRNIGKTGFRGGLILISGADEKLLSTVNKLAVLQGVRVLGQLQKPVDASILSSLLAHIADVPAVRSEAKDGQHVTRDAIVAAMEKLEFSIWFQPKVDAHTLHAVGVEALARWQLADGKYVSPDEFIQVAEREGIIGELSQQLVSLALSEAARLFAAGYRMKISINLSGSWLNDLSLPDFILAKTRSAGLKAEDVILEVTETGVMEDVTAALDVLTRLRLKGFGLSIDDFGIGYSSFEQLGRIPFTEMKLDRSFVSKGVEDPAARAILESSMDMANKLNLFTVAEGVETERDLKLVRSLGCDLVQGYLIAKPMPVKDVITWLANEKTGSDRNRSTS